MRKCIIFGRKGLKFTHVRVGKIRFTLLGWPVKANNRSVFHTEWSSMENKYFGRWIPTMKVARYRVEINQRPGVKQGEFWHFPKSLSKVSIHRKNGECFGYSYLDYVPKRIIKQKYSTLVLL